MTTTDKAALLTRFIEDRRRTPFAWGSNDCCLFAADWVLAATGRDIASDYRGRYSSALSALRFVKDGGGVEAMLERAGGQSVHPSLARRGDVIARDVGSGTGLGVCIGALAAFVAEDGLRFVDFAQGSCWRF
jgi:hypothetical protein